MSDEDELKALMAEQEGLLANEAADANLKLLALLGAMTGEVTPEYRHEVARALVYVMMALSSVRYCIESVTRRFSHGDRLVYLAMLVAVAFRMDHDSFVMELVKEAKTAGAENN